MCYHNSSSKDAKGLEARYKAIFKDFEQYKPIFHANGFNHPLFPVITEEDPGVLQLFSWGLVPHWVKGKAEALEIRNMTLNAMCETVFEKPSYRAAIKKKRCLVPSTGFFEWREVNKKKYPYFIKVKSTEIFSMGGISEEWVDQQTGEILNSFSIITTPANPLIEKIHNVKKRMPLILSVDREKEWLYPSLGQEEISELMKPFPENEMEAYTIGKLITSRTENSNVAEVIKKVDYPELIL